MVGSRQFADRLVSERDRLDAGAMENRAAPAASSMTVTDAQVHLLLFGDILFTVIVDPFATTSDALTPLVKG